MSLFVASLNSGSNGNCYYIGNEEEAIFVDAGLSCSEIEKRMLRMGLSMHKVKAIFISHEHSDHIFGIQVLAKRYDLLIYSSRDTWKQAGITLRESFLRFFGSGELINVGNLSVRAFPKKHDAVDPHSFIVGSASVTIGIFTDIGRPCDQVIKYFGLCNAAFLEANYDEEMLSQGKYPVYLKQRIRGDQGHLSNHQALDLFIRHRSAFMSHLILAHLSKENNSPEKVAELFKGVAGKTEIVIASRYAETAVYHIQHLPSVLNRTKRRRKKSMHQQLSLF